MIIAISINLTFTAISAVIGTSINISIISFILLLVGIILIAIGRKQYGEKHSRNVLIAVFIFIFSFIFSIIVVAAAIFSAISSEDLNSLKIIFYIIPIVAVLDGLMYLFLLYELEKPKGKIIVISGIAVTLISSLVIIALIMPSVDGLINEFDEKYKSDTITRNYYSDGYNSYFEEEKRFNNKVEEMQTQATRVGAVGIFGQLFYLFAFYLPYKRIKDGELMPLIKNKSYNMRRCMNCGRLCPSDSMVCAYCGNKFESTPNNKYQNYYY